jgi:hypothetical protein
MESNAKMKTTLFGGTAASCAALLLAPGLAVGQHFGPWNESEEKVEALSLPAPVNDGCPIEAPDGLHFYFASNRGGEGTKGGMDIFVAERASLDSPWTNIQPLSSVNSEYNDYCPTPLRGNRLLFVSERPVEAPCSTGTGSGDVYITRFNRKHGWATPEHLGCVDAGTGPNTAGPEFSPSLVETAEGVVLYYSSNGGAGLQDIYVSKLGDGGRFEQGTVVTELSTDFDDRMPNVRKDGREIVFSSNRPMWGGGQLPAGGQDVYRATRESTAPGSPGSTWSDPENVIGVNTPADETRASMSRDGLRLYFGRAGDIYVTTREKLTDNE